MSIKQMTLVFNDETLKGNEKLLMLAIADNANDSGVCFPSWSTLMKKTSMSRNSLAKWLGALEEKQYLFRKQRSRKNGSKTSNKFLIYPLQNKDFLDFEDMEIFEDLFTKVPKGELPKEETQSTKSMTTKVPKGELGEGGKVPKGELLEPSLNLNHQSNRHSLCVAEQKENLFNQFWTAYPKKVSKQTAKKAFMKKDNFDNMPHIQEVIQKINLLSVTDKWTKDKGQYIPNPATWLNAHGWEDEVELSDYDKAKAIAKAKGMTMSEFYQEMHGV